MNIHEYLPFYQGLSSFPGKERMHVWLTGPFPFQTLPETFIKQLTNQLLIKLALHALAALLRLH